MARHDLVFGGKPTAAFSVVLMVELAADPKLRIARFLVNLAMRVPFVVVGGKVLQGDAGGAGYYLSCVVQDLISEGSGLALLEN